MSDRSLGYFWLATMLGCMAAGLLTQNLKLFEISISGFIGFGVGRLSLDRKP